MLNKKAISPVVATALLLVVAVVAVVGFQTFFNTYSSGLFSKVETQSNNENMNTGINFVNDNNLYFNNANTNNITITSVKVDGIDCNISMNVSSGIAEFNLTICTENLTTSTPEVVVYTTNKIYSEKYFSTNIISDSSISSFINATGGTITYFGNYKIHTFTTNGTFNVTSGSGTVEYLVVAGGGGGGGGRNDFAIPGGGGGGGVLSGNLSILTIQSYNVIVGSGGNGGLAAGAGSGNSGSGGFNSTFENITARGGGGGASIIAGSNNGGDGGNLQVGGNEVLVVVEVLARLEEMEHQDKEILEVWDITEEL